MIEGCGSDLKDLTIFISFHLKLEAFVSSTPLNTQRENRRTVIEHERQLLMSSTCVLVSQQVAVLEA